MADGEAYQLKPNKKDPEAFERLFSASADEIFEAISRLEIINISLNYGDNPQLIFEGLNSTGLDLSEGDKKATIKSIRQKEEIITYLTTMFQQRIPILQNFSVPKAHGLRSPSLN